MQRTGLYEEHLKLQGKMVEFAGWNLPVYYTGIIEEHLAVRETAGLFDVSHLGRLDLTGEDVVEVIQSVATNDISAMNDGEVLYSLICNPQGGIEDDILIYKFPDKYMMIVNAVNADKIIDIIHQHSKGKSFHFVNKTDSTCMIALQGPASIKIMHQLIPILSPDYVKYSFTFSKDWILSATGYTGEIGYELILPSEEAPLVWNQLLKMGKPHGLIPCGLGARDTLRLEAGNCLYGHEMNAEINPFEAGLGFAVKLNKPGFIGKSALVELKAKGITKKLVGLEMTSPGIPRDHYGIQKIGVDIGHVTSGSYIPSLKKSVALGYVTKTESSLGNPIDIMIRNKPCTAVITNKKWR